MLVQGLHPTIRKKVPAALQAITETPSCDKELKEGLAGLIAFGSEGSESCIASPKSVRSRS